MSKVIYSDQENKRWWDGLGKAGQSDLFEKIDQKATSSMYKAGIKALRERCEKGEEPSAGQLISLRKWS